MVELRNDGSLGLDVIWSPCSTDSTWNYMGFGRHRNEWRMGLTSKPERQLESVQYSSKNSGK
jgi:hypothetical protein